MADEKVKRLNVLISAYACEPNKGSEPGVGWNVAKEMAKYHNVWVITRANNREVIKKELEVRPVEGLNFLYYDLPKWLCWWKKGGQGVNLYYYLWQIGIYSVVKKKHQVINFDLIHHVTFVRYWMPSFLSLLPVPFIWGPVGGGESAPPGLIRSLPLRYRLKESLRSIARWLGEHDPFVKMTACKANKIFAATEETRDRIKNLTDKDAEVYPAIGVSQGEVAQGKKDASFIFISVGRLHYLKGFIYGIKAFSRVVKKEPQCEYWVVGDGPLSEGLSILSESLGISHKVIFFGELPHHEVLQKIREADALVHPSMYESGGMVCLEALSLGKKLIIRDASGYAFFKEYELSYIVNESNSETGFVNELEEKMLEACLDSTTLNELNKCAQFYCWKNKAIKLREEYENVF